MRRSSFTVDAESVQGNPGATVTFRKVTVGEREQYISDPKCTDIDVLRTHLIAWKGILDDEGHEIPSPEDEPGIEAKLYLDEVSSMVQLLFQGPDGENAKN